MSRVLDAFAISRASISAARDARAGDPGAEALFGCGGTSAAAPGSKIGSELEEESLSDTSRSAISNSRTYFGCAATNNTTLTSRTESTKTKQTMIFRFCAPQVHGRFRHCDSSSNTSWPLREKWCRSPGVTLPCCVLVGLPHQPALPLVPEQPAPTEEVICREAPRVFVWFIVGSLEISKNFLGSNRSLVAPLFVRVLDRERAIAGADERDFSKQAVAKAWDRSAPLFDLPRRQRVAESSRGSTGGQSIHLVHGSSS